MGGIDFATNMYLNYVSPQPSDVKGRANMGVEFYKRLLYQDFNANVKLTLPVSDWNQSWFRYWLFNCGSIACFYSDDMGWLCNPWSYTSLDWQFQPKELICTNPYWKKGNSYKPVVGEDCEIVKINYDFVGVDSIITRYAEMLAQCDSDINVNLMNAKAGVIFYADGKKNADEAKVLYGKITAGEPAVYTEKSENLDGEPGFQPFFQNIKQLFIGTELCDLKNAIRNQFWTEIGTPNANTDKKERLISDEVNANNEGTKSKLQMWCDVANDCFDKLSKLPNAPKKKGHMEMKFKESEVMGGADAVGNDAVRQYNYVQSGSAGRNRQ